VKLGNVITPFKVGLLVIAAAVGTIFMIVQFTSGMAMNEDDSYLVYAYFDDVTGLAVRSRVVISGIPVGYIRSIRLEKQKARVDIMVDNTIALHKGDKQPGGWNKNGATVSRKQASLIGDYYLELSAGTAGDTLKHGDEIENVLTAVGPEELMENFNTITKDIQQVTESLAEVFGGENGAKRIDQMVSDLQQVLSTVRIFVEENRESLGRIVINAELTSAEVREFAEAGTELMESMLRDARAVVQEVKFIIGQSSGDLQAGLGTLQGTLSRLQSTLDSLNYSLQNIQDITDKVNEGEGTVGKLINDPSIANRTDRILADAEEYVDSLARLKTIVELRSAYYVKNARFKNTLGLKLQPANNKYYLIQLVDDFRGTTRVVRDDVNTTQSNSQDPLYRETRVTTTDEFKFSAQLARGLEVSPSMMLFGRFGIMESSGGLGADLYLTEGYDFKIATDLFDFGRNINPRLRARATYEFFEFAYIMGGVDDIFNGDQRDYYFGIGLEFNDDDLKALISTTGVPAP